MTSSKAREKGDGIERHADVDGGGELRADTAHALSGGAFALMGFAFDDDDVAAARFGEVVCDGGADNAASDDDDVRRVQIAPQD